MALMKQAARRCWLGRRNVAFINATLIRPPAGLLQFWNWSGTGAGLLQFWNWSGATLF
eukprot:CAMPEP_0119108466 /NCGR_PEP_ID=MMETSP1180-20130426/14555_1 /TAXON_ID=3052 ORGANISM="Chlamydomonas cf sp, Strain CCMP681" /NCGR_SAMPLE_ID=MMETSP1180 /ASSEMBLY_ACC=CAM_ASM_000741 /LENGTH=57 /DNA_ID=CAMNT_0007094081 /DNA_START=52 /DNA_END=225 /DNA_ORIENTATION=-